jgi:hypothetical protein
VSGIPHRFLTIEIYYLVNNLGGYIMAHIVEFSIAGLAGYERVYSQKLNEDINIFFGLNGSGKTSLLKILHSAMNNDTSILENVPFKNAEVKIYSKNHNIEYRYYLEQRKPFIFTEDINTDIVQEALFVEEQNRKIRASRGHFITRLSPRDELKPVLGSV